MSRLRSLLGRLGLRTRLGLAVAVAALVTAGAAFVIVYRNTSGHVSTEIDSAVRSNATTFATAINAQVQDGRGSPQAVLASAKRYAAAQPFGASASLFFVVIPGVGHASNHAELFGGGPPDDGETEAEQQIENAQGRVLAAPSTGFRTLYAPDAGQMRVYEIPVQITGHLAYVGAGVPLATLEVTQHGVLKSFVVAGLVAALLAVGAGFLIGGWVSAPLRRIAGVATRIDGGDLTPRIQVSTDHAGHELRTLVDSFNRMLDRLEAAFAHQREFVADASHELRTPLTVIRGQLELLDATEGVADSPEVARLQRVVEAEVARLSRLVDDLLLLAQTDRVGFLHVEAVPLRQFVTELWEGLSLIAERHFAIGQIPEVEIGVDPDRLAQALRNLAANAIAQTEAPNGLVAVEAHRLGEDRIRIVVSDDGPGVVPAERELIFERFHRTDPARTRTAGGAGLGLAIVRAIVTAHHGAVRVTARDGGGARFELDLPLGAAPN